jgi:hypothetical protein
MTIEIRRPELEALIRERMKTGAFRNVEDVLMQALQSMPLPVRKDVGPSERTSTLTGADLIVAMQASPYKEIDLEPLRDPLPVRESSF